MLLKIPSSLLILILVYLCLGQSSADAQALSGVTGLFQIPTAEMMPDKSVRLSHHVVPQKYSRYRRVSYVNAGYIDNAQLGYTSNSVTLSFLPRMEVMFRYSYELDVPRGPDVEIFMDRMVAARFLLIRESERLPAVVIGLHDPGGRRGLSSNGYFAANYLVASKNLQLGYFKYGVHSGYAFDFRSQQSIEYRGLFGGVSLEHEQFEWIQLILEYDSFQINTAVKILLLDRIQLLGGLYNLDKFAGGISYRFQF